MDPLSAVGGGGSFDAVVQRLLALERQPLDRLLLQRDNLTQSRGVFQGLSSVFSSLRTKASNLQRVVGSPLEKFKASSTDGDKVAATAGARAIAGSYSVEVSQLAQAHALATDTVKYDDQDFTDPGGGTKEYEFEITVGDGEAETISISVGPNATNKSVLEQIAEEVNRTSSGVRATVTTTNSADGEGKLVFRSVESGTANQITINDTVGTLTAQLGFTETQTALDAQVRVDGVDIVSSSNTISDALPGVTLNLRGLTNTAEAPDEHTPVTISVSGNLSGIRASLEDFIGSYNAAIDELATVPLDDLRNVSGLREMRAQLQSLVGRNVSLGPGAADGAPVNLFQIGVEVEAGGTLRIVNQNRLDQAVRDHGPASIAALFNTPPDPDDPADEGYPQAIANSGVAHRLESFLDSFLRGPQPRTDAEGQIILDEQGRPIEDGGGTLRLLDRQISFKDRRLETRIKLEEDRLEVRERALRTRLIRIQGLISSVAAQNGVMSALQASIFGGQG